MKSTLRLLLLLSLHGFFLLHPVFGQVMEIDTSSQSRYVPPAPERYSIGLDVLKNIPFWLRGGRAPLFSTYGTQHNRLIMEVTFRKETNTPTDWVGTLGYTQLRLLFDPKTEVTEQQKVRGWYAKAGREYSLHEGRKETSIGVMGVATFCQYRTDLRYPGPTFGDYTTEHHTNNIGIGFEPYFALDFFPKSRWMLRWITRLDFHYRLFGEGYTPYYPGAGNASGSYDLIFSGGTTLQLHYRFRTL